MKKFNTAIVGATGAVGQEFLKLIEERNFPFGELKMLASSRSAGKKINFMGKEYTVEETTEKSFDGVKFALFAGGGSQGGRNRHRQFIEFPHGSRSPACRARSQSASHFAPQRNNRQPELLNNNHGHGVKAALQFVENQARCRIDLSSGIGRGARRHGRIKIATGRISSRRGSYR